MKRIIFIITFISSIFVTNVLAEDGYYYDISDVRAFCEDGALQPFFSFTGYDEYASVPHIYVLVEILESYRYQGNHTVEFENYWYFTNGSGIAVFTQGRTGNLPSLWYLEPATWGWVPLLLNDISLMQSFDPDLTPIHAMSYTRTDTFDDGTKSVNSFVVSCPAGYTGAAIVQFEDGDDDRSDVINGVGKTVLYTPIGDDGSPYLELWRGQGEIWYQALIVTSEELSSVTYPWQNTLIASTEDNYLRVYRLATNEIQINIGPDEEGKSFVFIFNDNFEFVRQYVY